MIWESSYWKDDVLAIAVSLEKRIIQKKWFDTSKANTEKEIMLSAFMVRKLFESCKIDFTIQNKSIPIVQYPSNGKEISLLRRMSPEKYFHLDKPTETTTKVIDLYNNIIHSYIFIMIFEDDNKLRKFWVASDRNKFKFMMEIKVSEYISILREVGNFWPISAEFSYDPNKNDYTVKYRK